MKVKPWYFIHVYTCLWVHTHALFKAPELQSGKEKNWADVAFPARSDDSHRDKTHISEERLFMFAVFGTNSVSYHCLECDWILHAPIMIAQIHSQPVKGIEPAQLAELDCVYVKYLHQFHIVNML